MIKPHLVRAYYHWALDMFDGMNRDSKSFAKKYMEVGQNYKASGKLTMARNHAPQFNSL